MWWLARIGERRSHAASPSSGRGGEPCSLGDRVLHSDSKLDSAIRLLARKRHEPAIGGSRKNRAVFRRQGGTASPAGRRQRLAFGDQRWRAAANEEVGSGVRNERRDTPRSERRHAPAGGGRRFHSVPARQTQREKTTCEHADGLSDARSQTIRMLTMAGCRWGVVASRSERRRARRSALDRRSVD